MKRATSAVQFVALRQIGVITLSASLCLACTGEMGGGSGKDDDQSPSDNDDLEKPDTDTTVGMDDEGNIIEFERPSYKCDASLVGDSVGLRKLTNTQYKNTLLDLFRWALGKNDVSDIQTALSPGFSKLPAEKRDTSVDIHGTFRQLDQALQDEHVERTYEIALAVGQKVANDHMTTLLKDCQAAASAGCVRDFIRTFGARALRRPLDDGEATFYESFYGDLSKLDKAAFADLIAGFLTAPQFLYTVEHGDAEVSDKENLFKLSPYELASRLSYHFWQTMPDDELWQKAESGQLASAGEYEKQVDRLLSDARVQNATAEFYADLYRLDALPDFTTNVQKPQYKTFLGDTSTPSSMLRQAMVDDVVDMMQHYTWKVDGKYDDALTSELSFASSAELAGIYGVEPWDKMNDGEPVMLPAGERPGLITRSALLATELVTTRPVLKGVALRTGLLCDTIPPPPDGAANVAQDTVNKTTRETVELITEQDGTACKGCHETYINNLGYPTENFDALGRARAEEMVFDENLEQTGTKPVNTVSRPRVFLDDQSEVDGAMGLAQKIAESGKAHACIARNYFRFTFARMEDWSVDDDYAQTSRDGCVLERLRRAVDKDGGLRGMIREVAMAPEFQQRLIVQ